MLSSFFYKIKMTLKSEHVPHQKKIKLMPAPIDTRII